MPDGGECAFDRVGHADVFPVLGREVVEREQGVLVLDQLTHCLIVFRAIGDSEEIEGLLGIVAGLKHPKPVLVAA